MRGCDPGWPRINNNLRLPPTWCSAMAWPRPLPRPLPLLVAVAAALGSAVLAVPPEPPPLPPATIADALNFQKNREYRCSDKSPLTDGEGQGGAVTAV